MPHTPETIFGVPIKMSDESPFPPDATPLSGQRPIRLITGDSILTIGSEEVSVDVTLRMAAQAPAMYELLKELELSVPDGHFLKCPVCGGELDDPTRTRGICVSALGHNSDCRLAAVLKAVEGECPPPNTTD